MGMQPSALLMRRLRDAGTNFDEFKHVTKERAWKESSSASTSPPEPPWATHRSSGAPIILAQLLGKASELSSNAQSAWNQPEDRQPSRSKGKGKRKSGISDDAPANIRRF